MKEIVLKENQFTKIPNSYKNTLIVRCTNDGYYISCNDKEYGPFFKVLTDTYAEFNNDVFVYGWRPEKTIVYRNGIYGLEQKDELDTTVNLAKQLKTIREKPEFFAEEGCTLLGEALVYRMYKADQQDNFSNQDGYVRLLQRDEKRLIFKTPENQIFIVNPKNIKPYSSYIKFDSFDELCIAARRKSIDYAFNGRKSCVSNKSLYYILSTAISNNLPYSVIQKILIQAKEMVGIENYRNLDFSIDYSFIKHANFDMEEYLNALNNIDLDDLEAYINDMREKDSLIPNTACLFNYEKNIIHPTLISAVNFGEFVLTKEQESASILYPNTEKTNAAFNNPNSINWVKIATSLYGEKTEAETQICKCRTEILSQLRKRARSREPAE